MDLGGPWCWTALGGALLGEVLARFRDYESMTWEQIDGPTGSHGVEPWKLSREAQLRLAAIRQDDASELFSLRITGRRRVWGILDEHVLRLLWWDPEHQVCPSARKHTSRRMPHAGCGGTKEDAEKASLRVLSFSSASSA